MMRRLPALLLLCTLAACATTERYEAILESWVGKTENALVQAWGPPDSVYETSGTKYLTYTKTGTQYVPGTPPTYRTIVNGKTSHTRAYGGTPGYLYSQNCKTSFSIVNEIIQKWRWEGNACRAQ
ncbi:MAG: hypothetical protein HOM58_03400 [Rhodospirillaceae bacterium]|jgi:hypothetical protein|nr:hypothetical protein [Rhodospirillaceae bacterium]MBT5458288.1 hypothetical protein [Rhodospirillaceae bacterium]